MQSTVSELSNGGEPREWKVVLRRIVRSRWTFAVLQVLDQFGSGEFDVIAIGRALLADPTWVNRLRDDCLDGFHGFDAETALAQLT